MPLPSSLLDCLLYSRIESEPLRLACTVHGGTFRGDIPEESVDMADWAFTTVLTHVSLQALRSLEIQLVSPTWDLQQGRDLDLSSLHRLEELTLELRTSDQPPARSSTSASTATIKMTNSPGACGVLALV